MQLPRGTFREIRKDVTVEHLSAELERTKFSGICSISSGTATGTLVFNRGKCILIKFNGKSGDAGWNELQNAMAEEADAALSTLDNAQIQLSLEFNKNCRLVKGGTPAPQHPEPHKKPIALRGTTTPPPPIKFPLAKPAAPVASPPLSPVKHAAHTVHATQRPSAPAPASQVPVAPRAPVFQKAAERRAVPEDETTAPDQDSGSFGRDIDTFDTMDIETVTDKIRNDCKTMIKQLHLEHLMER
jgi:hypothetical protein